VSRNWFFLLAGLLFGTGYYATVVPIFTYETWLIIYTVTAFFAVLTHFRTDVRHLRVLTALIVAISITHGLAWWSKGYPSAILVESMVAVLAVSYYKARVQSPRSRHERLPEKLPGWW